MATVADDMGGNVDTGDSALVEFVASGNPLSPKKAVLDGGATISSIEGVNTVRAEIGNGSGSTGWVLVRDVGSTGEDHDAYVQLSKIESVVYSTAAAGGQIAVLKKAGASLGEVFATDALAAVKAKFPP
jgi:hypothetical protein